MQHSSCRLRARIYEVRCYLNVVEERRRSSVRLKIDDRVFSWCRWQRTRSLSYLTVTQRLSVGRCLEDDPPDELTHAAGRRSTVKRYIFRTATSVSVSTGHRAVPVVVDVVETRHRRSRSRQLFTGKFQPSSTWPRRSVVVTTGHPQGPAVVDVLTYYRRRRTSR